MHLYLFCNAAVACEQGVHYISLYLECDGKVGGPSEGRSQWDHHRVQAQVQET